MIILALFFIVVLILFTRSLLILIGRLKDPILRVFQNYGEPEVYYNPLPALLFWFGSLLILIRHLMINYWRPASSLMMMFVIVCYLLAYFSSIRPDVFGQRGGTILGNPSWLRDLTERTSRYERRRIAYMWLHLPPRLRIVYNSNDRAFREWADMVILSTLL